MEMCNPFLPIYLHSLNSYGLLSANTWSILAYTLPLVSAIIFSPIWGKYADKFGYKTMILRAAAALALIQILIYLTNNILVFITLRFIQGAIAGYLLASQSYAVILVSKEYRSRVLAWLQSSTAVGIALGPLFGVVLANIFNYNNVFLISSLIAGFTFLILLFKLKKITPAYLPKENHNGDISPRREKNKLDYLYFSVIFLSIFLFQAAKFIPLSFFAVYAKDFFNANPLIIGAIYSAPAFSLLFISAPLGHLFDKLLKNNNQKYYFASGYFVVIFTLAIVAIFVHTTTHNIYEIIIARLILGVAFAGTLPCLFSLTCRIRDTNFGSLIGYCNSLSKFGSLTGIFAGGIIFQLANVQVAFYVASALYFTLVVTHLCLLYTFNPVISSHSNKEFSSI
ncbi:rhizoferrin export MFS transporter FslB [Francisella sp. 19S2-4]|uniref:rhizoferrin export MFS transporter FslB n=2 Tax=unclassified Francisella TaxID=2610885 RepID=UPI002E36BB0B|nr:rhizoferrin export MFS transporter FslB [Francisella sp. 19S2-4]MED7819129.1 rhizoferrin export MFS transporter FslB [Francisella sp. 19S2-4]MED7831017.1 rhizoferrin export MFS transporter FslB [Francisella sp. 19S2-10]